MPPTIRQTISAIKANPELEPLTDLNEEAVKQAIVVPLLEAAGWNSRRVKSEFVTEFGVTNAGSERVDYSLRVASSNKVFVEAKTASEDLHGHARQLLGYCRSATDAPDIGVLTNGRLWWLYSPSPSRQGGWEKPRQFCTIDIISDKPREVRDRFHRFLLKDRVATGTALKAAGIEYNKLLRNEEMNRAIVEAWNQIVQQQQEGLIDLIANATEHICNRTPDQNLVRDFLKRRRSQFVVSEETASPPQTTGRGTFNPTGKKPFEIQFQTNVRKVNGWPSVLRELCVLVYDDLEDKDDFGRVLTLRGSKNHYFSSDGNNLQKSEWIEAVGYYVERNGIGSSIVVSICDQILNIFGYPRESLEIKTSDSATHEYSNLLLPR